MRPLMNSFGNKSAAKRQLRLNMELAFKRCVDLASCFPLFGSMPQHFELYSVKSGQPGAIGA